MAGAAWYGRLEGETNAMTPKNPVDYAGVLKAPVIGFYGGKDTGIPQESIERMRGALKVVDDESEINVYPDAQHGFNADYRPSYNKDAAQDAWKKMLAWFKKYGVVTLRTGHPRRPPRPPGTVCRRPTIRHCAPSGSTLSFGS